MGVGDLARPDRRCRKRRLVGRVFFCVVLVLTGLAVQPAGAEERAVRSLTLDEAMTLAEQRNERLQIASRELDRADAEVLRGWSEALPRLTLESRYNRSWLLPTLVFDTPEGRQSFTIGTTHNVTAGVSFRQPLYSGGKVRAALSAARAFRRLSNAGYRDALGRLRAQVETEFYDVLAAQALVEVARTALLEARSNLAQVESLRRAGRVSDYEVLRARLRVSTLRPDSIAAETALRVATLSLRNTVGLPAEEAVRPVGTFRTATQVRHGDLDDLVRKGLQDRPEVVQLEMEVRMRREAVTVERSSRRPSLDIVANGQLEMQSNDFAFGSDERHQSWNTGLVMSFPIFDGLDSRARVSAAKVDLRQAELRLEELRKSITLEVEQAYHRMREAAERVDAREQGVREAEEGARIARNRYTQGVGTQLEVLDAELVLTQGRTDLVMARRDLAAAIIALELGVGYEAEDKTTMETIR